MQYSVLCQKYNQKIPIHEYLEEVFFEANSFITHIVVYSSFSTLLLDSHGTI